MIYKILKTAVLRFSHEWLPANHGRVFALSSVAGSVNPGSNGNASGTVSKRGRV